MSAAVVHDKINIVYLEEHFQRVIPILTPTLYVDLVVNLLTNVNLHFIHFFRNGSSKHPFNWHNNFK